VRPASVLREHRLRGWLVAAGVTALAAALRAPGLARPHALVFDETYYVKDAWTLMHLGYEAKWPEKPNPAFVAGDVDTYYHQAEYVVHPQIGKWVISLGMHVFGAENSTGWRLSVLLCGLIAVFLLTRIARRLFRSDLLGGIAGTLMALDGLAIVMSRTGVLDGILMVFVLGAFGALLLDRDATAEALDARMRPSLLTYGPSLGVRWWRVLGGVLLGLACGVKWSALWFIAFFGLLSVWWDASARRRAGVQRWWQGTLLRDVGPALVSIVGVSAVMYLVGWWSWFATRDSYQRHWAQAHPGEGWTWLPDTLNSFVHYHLTTWDFHTHLTSHHDYDGPAWGWMIQYRPTSYYYEKPEPAQQMCGADHCSQAITSLGNPIIWWLGCLALVVALWWWLRRRDGIAMAALSGLVAGWFPWFLFPERTIFTFYAIVMLPWVAMTITWVAARWLGLDGDEDAPPVPRWRRRVAWGVAGLIVAVTIFFYPIWTAMVVPFRFWQLHMWLPSWV